MTFTKPTARRRGEAIRKARREQGLSLFALAARTGVDPGHLSRAERGLAGIGDDYLTAIATTLGMDPESLTTTEDTEPCRNADSATDGEPSRTRATPAAPRSAAPSAVEPAESAHAANRAGKAGA